MSLAGPRSRSPGTRRVSRSIRSSGCPAPPQLIKHKYLNTCNNNRLIIHIYIERERDRYYIYIYICIRVIRVSITWLVLNNTYP